MLWWSKVNYLIAVQGFCCEKHFIFKEVATLNLESGDIKYYLIKPSVPYRDLDEDTLQNVDYVYNCVHGISYSSGFMCKQYALQLICSKLQDVAKIVCVKAGGDGIQKLRLLLGNGDVCNAEDSHLELLQIELIVDGYPHDDVCPYEITPTAEPVKYGRCTLKNVLKYYMRLSRCTCDLCKY